MTIDEVITMLNSEDCNLATDRCLMKYKERDCWKCILKEYTKTVYNKAIDDFVKFASDMPTVEEEDGEIRPMRLNEMAEQLKAGGNIELSEYSKSKGNRTGK